MRQTNVLLISISLSMISTIAIMGAKSPLIFSTSMFNATAISTATTLDELFASPTSVGAIAVGLAEGNYTIKGKQTSVYFGEKDPADFVLNRGFCSDRGRGLRYLKQTQPKRKKFSLSEITTAADSRCLDYIKADFPKIEENMRSHGLDPSVDIEVAVNAADLRNQANPSVHTRFIERYSKSKEPNRIAKARTLAFKVGEKWTSTGLQAICDREKRDPNPYNCTYKDQNRRAEAINATLRKWKKIN
jgi:hypothetical protein